MYSQDYHNWTTNVKLVLNQRLWLSKNTHTVSARAKYKCWIDEFLPEPQAPVGANPISCNEWRIWLKCCSRKGEIVCKRNTTSLLEYTIIDINIPYANYNASIYTSSHFTTLHPISNSNKSTHNTERGVMCFLIVWIH